MNFDHSLKKTILIFPAAVMYDSLVFNFSSFKQQDGTETPKNEF